MLVRFKKASLLTSVDTHLIEELTVYCFVLKATRVFPIPIQVEQTENGEHFAND